MSSDLRETGDSLITIGNYILGKSDLSTPLKGLQYFSGKNIGEGTFGKVKLGTHIPTNEKVLELYYLFTFSIPSFHSLFLRLLSYSRKP